MTWPKWFARWRLRVWDRRLAVYRREWNRVTVAGPDPDHVGRYLDHVNAEAFWERLVTKALVKRTKWRKAKGADGRYLVQPKLSTPPDRPES